MDEVRGLVATVSKPIRSLAIAIIVIVAQAGSVSADTFGSNTAVPGSPAHACDDTSASQCIANNGTHWWYPSGLQTNQLSATRYASDSVYDPVADVDTVERADSSNVDLLAFDSTYTLCIGPGRDARPARLSKELIRIVGAGHKNFDTTTAPTRPDTTPSMNGATSPAMSSDTVSACATAGTKRPACTPTRPSVRDLRAMTREN